MHIKSNSFYCDVVIPTYNSSKFITHAINSVIAQINVRSQVYVVDDGSTDETIDLIKPIIKKNKNIHYIYQKNSGLSSARNTGIKAGKSDYIAFLDADDIWKEDKLFKEINAFALSKDSKLGVIYTDYNNINEAGNTINYPSYRPSHNNTGDIYNNLISGNIVAGSGSGVLVKRECFAKVGLFDVYLPSCEDWDMWLRISKHFHFDYIPEKLVFIRRSKSSMSTDLTNMCLGMGKIMAKHQGLLNSRKARKSFQKIMIHQIIKEYPNVKIIKFIKQNLDYKVYEKLVKDYHGMIGSILEILSSKTINKIRNNHIWSSLN